MMETTMETLKLTTSIGDLTPREREVAHLVADGKRNEEVAQVLGVSTQTVKSHLKAIFDKLRLRNRVEVTRVVLGFPVVQTPVVQRVGGEP
jgi:DNA-binding CsgD family transcriptional regulator